ncbi:MAG: stage II sporulation protein E [Clostridia bacterium]|jgi:stage II sporulation protein E|nr:stage II sporulation protein E [Clostridia bacterium]
MLKLSLPKPFHSFDLFKLPAQIWLKNIGVAGLSCLLAKAALMGELYPFGTSFLAGVCMVYPAYAPAALAGALLGSALGSSGWPALSYILCLFLLYLVFSKGIKEETHWLLVPGLTAAAQLLVRGAVTIFTANELYQWIGVVFESFFAGVLTLVAVSGLQAWPRLFRGQSINPEERTSLALIMIGALVGVAQAEIFGLGAQSVLSRWIILWGACLAGPGGGAAAGVAVGLVPTIQGSLTSGPIAVYALAGMLGGMFNNFRKTGVVIGFMLAVLFMSLFFAEQIIIEQALWETLLAVILFFGFNLPLVKLKKATGLDLKEMQLKRENNQEVTERLRKISQVFSELGKTFQSKEGEEAPDKDKLNDIFSRVAARVCEGCSLHRICWEQDFYKTYRAIMDACAVLETNGGIQEKQFGAGLKRRCMRLRELSVALDAEVEHMRLIDAYRKQLQDCREMVHKQLLNLAEVIEGFSGDLNNEVFSHDRSGALLKKRLEEKGIRLQELLMIDLGGGEKEIAVTQSGCPEKGWCKTMVAPNISQITGKNYRLKSLDCTFGDGVSCTYRLVPGNFYGVQVGCAQCPQEGQKISGDICASFTLTDQRLALIMSDGMGTGEEAHNESALAVNLLEKLLMAGFSAETAIKTINTVLFLRSGKESFVTLDLVLINRTSGLADFLKIGGAPSLISSPKGLSVVQAQSPPAGILDKIEMQNFRYTLDSGNVIIMMSDGVWEAINNAGGPAGWFEDVLQRMNKACPQQIADNILYLAQKAAEKAKDDMCVQVALIESREIA